MVLIERTHSTDASAVNSVVALPVRNLAWQRTGLGHCELLEHRSQPCQIRHAMATPHCWHFSKCRSGL